MDFEKYSLSLNIILTLKKNRIRFDSRYRRETRKKSAVDIEKYSRSLIIILMLKKNVCVLVRSFDTKQERNRLWILKSTQYL